MGTTLKRLFFVLFISLFVASYSQARDLSHFSLPKIKLVDQNMYLGADLSPIFLTRDLDLIEPAIQEIIASNYPARAEAVARMIRVLRPHVVCLQEAWVFEFLPYGISWDFKELLLDALGGDYKEIVTNESLMEIDLRETLGVRIKDQDVIIAKTYVGIVGEPETIVFDDQLTLTLPPPINTVTVSRGLSAAKVRIRGAEYLIANTHLEAFNPIVRLSQAQQIVDELENLANPVILAGDFNAEPGWPAYETIIAEFDDAWTERLIGRRDPGFTFGRIDLINDDAVFDERIDFVFTRNHRAVTLVGLTVGKSEFSKTDPVPYPPGSSSLVRLWPSDHLGLFFSLILPR